MYTKIAIFLIFFLYNMYNTIYIGRFYVEIINKPWSKSHGFSLAES